MTDLIGPVARVGSGGGAGEVTVGQVLRAPLLGGGREGVISTCKCVVIPSPMREGSTLLGDHRGSILLNRAETSQEG